MKQIAFDELSCPLDGKKLQQQGNSLVCPDRHCFDIDKRGAVNLLPVQFKASKDPGDSKEMVAARTLFLEGGFYKPLAEAVQKTVASYVALRAPKCLAVLDAGCGEGYYTQNIVDYLSGLDHAAEFSCVGLDVSKPAIHAASRRNKLTSWIVGTNAHLPLAEASVDCLFCLFGFPSWDEFKRVLKPRGIVVMMDPAADHLIELRKILYVDPRKKEEREAEAMEGWELFQEERLTVNAGPIPAEQIDHLLVMTPHGYRAHATMKDRARNMDFPGMTLDVHLRIFALKQPL